MNELLQFIKEFIGIVGAICGIAAFIIAVAGILRGFPVEGIIAALIIAAAGILWGYHVRIIRKKDDELASLRERIKQAETPEQKDTALETMPQWSSAQVCGTYRVEGKNHLNKKQYFGELQIKEWGELLLGTWVIATEEGGALKQSNGTGLLVDNALAFTFKYTDAEDTRPGVGLYKILSDDHMRGKWGVVKASNAGFEECWKKRA